MAYHVFFAVLILYHQFSSVLNVVHVSNNIVFRSFKNNFVRFLSVTILKHLISFLWHGTPPKNKGRQPRTGPTAYLLLFPAACAHCWWCCQVLNCSPANPGQCNQR